MLASPTGAVNIGSRVADAPVFEDFEMNMWSGGPATAAHEADNLAFPDNITGLGDQFLMMTIAG